MITKKSYESLEALEMASLKHKFKIYGNLEKISIDLNLYLCERKTLN
jgi:hypothetical protein